MYAKNPFLIPATALAICACAAPCSVHAAGSHVEVRMNVSSKKGQPASTPFVLFQTLPAPAAPAPVDAPPPVAIPPPVAASDTKPPTTPTETDAPAGAVSVVVPLYYFTDAPSVLRILRPDAQPINQTAYKEALSAVQGARRDVADKEADRHSLYAAVLADRSLLGQTQETPASASTASAAGASSAEAAAALSGATKALEAARQQLDAALADANVKEAAYARETEEWEADSIQGSRDPLRCVRLRTAGPGELFLRGTPPDISKVRQAIRELDQPAPQMRVTLWTVQVSGEGAQGDGPSRQRLGKAVDQVEEEMGLLRQQLAATTALFQKCVEDQVQKAAAAHPYIGDKPKDGPAPEPAEMFFYDDKVLARLGEKSDDPKSEAEPLSPSAYLHPNRINSLGETLLTLLLAKEEYREAAFRAFLKETPPLLEQMHEASLRRSGQTVDAAKKNELFNAYQDNIKITRLLAAFGYRQAQDRSLESLSGDKIYDAVARQQEYTVNIIRATLRQGHRQQALSHWDSLIETFNAAQPNEANDANAKAACDGVRQYFTAIAKNMAVSRPAKDGMQQAMADLNITGPGLQAILEPTIPVTTPDQMEAIRRALEEKGIEGLAQMAVGDQIIKQFVVAAEDDFDAGLIRPRLRGLQDVASRKSIELGIVQRTGILAGDRRSARVDPKASLEFSFPQPADLLKESVDLVKLVAKGTGAGVAANLTALAGTGDVGKVLDKLVDINNNRRTPPPDVYKIETGSGVTLTPFLLPDAQNMAFELDYSLSSPVTEPKDLKGRRVARIERHGLQTYVQDSSYEMRELSRFESSVKLAQPVIRSGGVPLLREIPGVRDIPILGYFSKSAGTGIGLQESLIFVHTVQYPTVKALISLF